MTRNAASRAIGYALVDPDIEEVEDQVNEAVASSSNSNDMVNILQYVAYSPSFQVPAFYFIVSDRSEWHLILTWDGLTLVRWNTCSFGNSGPEWLIQAKCIVEHEDFCNICGHRT